MENKDYRVINGKNRYFTKTHLFVSLEELCAILDYVLLSFWSSWSFFSWKCYKMPASKYHLTVSEKQKKIERYMTVFPDIHTIIWAEE